MTYKANVYLTLQWPYFAGFWFLEVALDDDLPNPRGTRIRGEQNFTLCERVPVYGNKGNIYGLPPILVEYGAYGMWYWQLCAPVYEDMLEHEIQ